MYKLSVVIPAYNESGSIAEVIERVLAVEPQLVRMGVGGFELIVVDDGSRDATAAIVKGYSGVKLVRHEVNRGYGAALKTGFSQAEGNLLAFLDADGTYPPEYLPELCQQAIECRADLVIGSRMSGRESKMPWMRRLGNTFFAGLLTLISKTRVADSASGMRVIRRERLADLYPLPDGLNFTPVMSTRAIHENLTIAEVPIPYDERVGRSKLSVVSDGQRFLKSIIWTAMAYNPGRILGLLGVGAVAVAGLVGLGLVAVRASGVTTLGPWGAFVLFMALVFGVSGVSVFTLGATFNYLVSLFHKHPVRQEVFDCRVFPRDLERHLGWLGGAGVAAGMVLGAACMGIALAANWPVDRLWLYLLGSAMSILIGVQMIVSWVIIGVLRELSEREACVAQDLGKTQVRPEAGGDGRDGRKLAEEKVGV